MSELQSVPGFPGKTMPMRDVSYQGEGHSHALFLGHMSFRVDLSCLCSSLHSQQILFPDMLLWSLEEWSLWTECLNGACHALWPWEVLKALGWSKVWQKPTCFFRDNTCAALGESVPRDGPGAEFYPCGQKSLIQGHPPFLMSLSRLPFPLRAF